ncbi:MAG: hypothetical protein M3295_01125, partial [Chloroflexota bacterium]|nr:hypothetical protein [Chloroflexota bacterium]
RTLAAPRLHGLQVALGTIAAYVLRDEAPDRLVAFHRRVGLPVHPRDLELGVDDVVDAIRCGPETRPGRSTILDRVTDRDVERLIAFYAAVS